MEVVEKLSARVFGDEEKEILLDCIDQLRKEIENDNIRQVVLLGLSGSNTSLGTNSTFEHYAIAPSTNALLMLGLMDVVKLQIISEKISLQEMPIE